MPELGQKLRAEREKRKLTASEVAAATHIQVQHIEAIERNDFSRMAAAAYAKGFIRLYAEFLDMDPHPLIRAYADMTAPGAPPHVPEAVASVPDDADEERREPLWRPLLRRVPWPRVALILGCAVLALFLFSAISRFIRIVPERSEHRPESEQNDAPPAIIQEPPPPSMEP